MWFHVPITSLKDFYHHIFFWSNNHSIGMVQDKTRIFTCLKILQKSFLSWISIETYLKWLGKRILWSAFCGVRWSSSPTRVFNWEKSSLLKYLKTPFPMQLMVFTVLYILSTILFWFNPSSSKMWNFGKSMVGNTLSV